jgi:hypothetical protein
VEYAWILLRRSTFRNERRGPPARPATNPSVWLGAYGPRMLDLTGRKANVCLPLLFLLEPDAAYCGLETVRAAAERATRQADDLTYAYNSGIWIDERAPATSGLVVGGPEPGSQTTRRVRSPRPHVLDLLAARQRRRADHSARE